MITILHCTNGSRQVVPSEIADMLIPKDHAIRKVVDGVLVIKPKKGWNLACNIRLRQIHIYKEGTSMPRITMRVR